MTVFLALIIGLSACGEMPSGDVASTHTQTETPTPVPTPLPTPEPPAPTVSTLAVCGDVMGHMPVVWDAWDEERQDYDFAPIMAGAAPYVAAADYAVVNLETVLGGGPKYTGYPGFNSPDGLAHSLKEVGFDLVLTANNHSLDQGHQALVRTLDVLDEVGLNHVGTKRPEETMEPLVADVGGIKVAFLGYSYGTNGNAVPAADPDCISLFNTDYMTSLKTPDTERMQADLEKAEALDADLIAVMIHWGVEYQIEQNAYQEEIADLLIKNGADVVLGGHSHVPQPIEWRTVAGVDGVERTGLVAYSLGNFISAQYMEYTYVTAVLNVELEKDNTSGDARVVGWSYVPIYVINRGEEAERRFELLDVEKEQAEESDEALMAELELAAADCQMIFGPNHAKG